MGIQLLVLIGGCQSSQNSLPNNENPVQVAQDPRYPFPYQVNVPNSRQELPDDLEEISGLGISGDGTLYAVQDEEGRVFKINGEEIWDAEFRKDGDYEGIEVLGEKVYVIKNSGTVYEIENLGTAEQTRKDYNDFLNDDYDAEGLCYHKETHSLLIACKEGIPDGDPNLRPIYRFDLATMKMVEKPWFTINLRDIVREVTRLSKEGHPEFVKIMEEKGRNNVSFGPSGIAIHPISGDYYITSARGNLLLITNAKGEVLFLEKLRKSVHRQPEGICFDTQGRMFISNEGDGGKGTILQFNMQD